MTPTSMLSVYHRLPYPFRVLVASVRGWQLKTQRYGPETEKLVQDALERESWSAEKWSAWQAEKLAGALESAAKNTPFYRNQWQKRRSLGDRSSWEMLANWPVLEKKSVRDYPEAFLADGIDRRNLISEHTSGTTGMPLSLWMEKSAVRMWYALGEARWRQWYGISRTDAWGIFGGQMVTPIQQPKPPFWVWNAGMKQLYLSSYHISRENVESYCGAIRSHALTYLLGYPSSLCSLAQFAQESQLNLPQMKLVISNAEPLYDHQRELLKKVFGCRVVDTYGLSENVCAASECGSGKLHLWPEAGLTEVLSDDADEPVGSGEIGRLVCTGLLNPVMPLIRYQVGDRAAIDTSGCDCGRHMPVLGRIEGRMDDIIVTADGRRIGRLDPVFKSDMPILEAQVIQESLDRIRVRYVPALGFNEIVAGSLVSRIKDRVGDMDVILERVEEIPRTANGKFRAVISILSEEQKRAGASHG